MKQKNKLPSQKCTCQCHHGHFPHSLGCYAPGIIYRCSHCSPTPATSNVADAKKEKKCWCGKAYEDCKNDLHGAPEFAPVGEAVQGKWRGRFNGYFTNVGWYPENKKKILSFIASELARQKKEIVKTLKRVKQEDIGKLEMAKALQDQEGIAYLSGRIEALDNILGLEE